MITKVYVGVLRIIEVLKNIVSREIADFLLLGKCLQNVIIITPINFFTRLQDNAWMIII